MRDGKQRMGIDIPKQIYEALKLQAQLHNITLTRYIVRAFVEQLKREGRYEDVD